MKINKKWLALSLLVGFLVSLLSLSFSQEKEVSLTVYNDNLALVKDVRKMNLPKGEKEVKFTDVAAQIDPTSVHFKSLTAPDKVAIQEQNYEYDLVSTSKMLEKYVDQTIKVYTKEQTYSGTLLSSSQGDVMLQEASGSIRVINRETIQNLEFPKLPEGLITRPTLVWILKTDKAGEHRAEVSYLTTGINWHAEYVGVSKQNDTVLELGGWVSIDNKSGATYENAKLKLVAGEVHRAEERVPILSRSKALMMAEAAGAPQFEEKAFFEYHLYTLQRPATVKDNQIKQISLFPTTETKVKKIFTYDGARDQKDVKVNLEFKNSKADGLGMPLPKGKIRVYKEDEADKSLEFIGEDFIDHTPKDEKVRVYLGNAFDVVGERIQKDRKDLSKRSREETWEIKLRNHKETDIEVTVIEHLYGDWEIRRSTHEWKKKDAQTIEFQVPVKKDGETVIEYVVLFRW